MGRGGGGGGSLMGTSCMPVRTRRICMHAFALLLNGLVSTHVLNWEITSRGATYPQDTTANPD